MDELQQIRMLGTRQLALRDGLFLLEQIRLELALSRSRAEIWGMTVALSNLALIPLNCIVNAFQLKAAQSIYQAIVRGVYEKVSRSGTRVDGAEKTALALLKKAISEELKRKGLTQFTPGVNILVGLAEDSLATLQAFQRLNAGKQEAVAIAHGMDRRIEIMKGEIDRLGIQLAEKYDRQSRIQRTA